MSATSKEFRRIVRRWLQSNDELVTLVRLNRSAGMKRWYLVRSLEDLDTVVSRSGPTDCLTVFADPHLPLRGVSGNAEVLEAVWTSFARSPDFLLGEVRAGDPELIDAEDFAPQDHVDVRRWLDEHLDVVVAGGPWPPFLDPDPEVAYDALVPNLDGSLSFDGAY